ncbi:2OG-Fe(II) oxygenase [Salegentibacter sp. LM13S]|uniref:2OG-Fe(II) oxygenase n=1 Tax=Salegentibacter lacus TaxID=2873599 RepID=UPI001CCD3656|nr:2OG-Fe(II) oxygenase [Salegentibacter lacus]MBZ9630448.1 2OG-Fe(II) oxygenase [Salegentibacter lacus]
MENLKTRITTTDWQSVAESMNEKGYAYIPEILTDDQCEKLIQAYDNEYAYRKTVIMERYRFGLGEYKYFDYPLPKIIQTLRESIYPKLSPIANLWMKVLKIEKSFPDTLEELQLLCHQSNQLKPTPLILKYGKGGFNTLHQDLYGEVYFPMQAVLFLNDPERDFTGGEFVLTQQVPRAQSKAIVLKPKKGDVLIFTTNFRPVKGTRGYYRANMRHGVSEVTKGDRHTLGIIFHDATS